MKQCCLLFFLLLHLVSAAQDPIRFHNLTMDDGLSYSLVFEILKDQQGFMWFGSTDGLNKFDSHLFTVYQNIPGDSSTMADNSVWALLEDSEGTLWVGTDGGGLASYDRRKDVFVHYQHDEEDPNSLVHNSVNSIMESNDGTLWIATYGGGLSRMIEPGVFEHYQHDDADPSTISNNRIHHLMEDRKGFLWIGTQNGLNRLNPMTGQITRYMTDTSDGALPNDNVLCVTEDQDGKLWVGTWGDGLYSFDPKEEVFEPFPLAEMEGARVPFVFVDHQNTVWVSVLGEGLFKVDRSDSSSVSYQHDPLVPESLINNDIWFMYEDDLERLWLGTAGGISWFSLRQEPIRSHSFQSMVDFDDGMIGTFSQGLDGTLYVSTGKDLGKMVWDEQMLKTQKVFSRSDIWSHAVTSNGEVWISCYGEGVYRYRSTEDPSPTLYDQVGDRSIVNSTYLFEDSSGKLWIGTYGNGLHTINPSNDRFEFFPLEDSVSGESLPVLTITAGDDRKIWIGTYGGGLVHLDPTTGKTQRSTKSGPSGQVLSHNTVLSVLPSEAGIVWIGTDGGGLNRLDTETGAITFITTREGLSSNVVLGVLEDLNEMLWLSTNAGITRYDPSNGACTVFDETDGLVSKGFNADAYFVDSHGILYFGSGNGFNYFHPDSIRPQTYAPPIYLHDLKILNRSIKGTGRMDAHINYQQSLTLDYWEDFFSLHFVTLDYQSPSSNQYEYRLNGFNEDWVYTTADDRQATFTNLDPGTYSFDVKASNADGVWADGKTLMVIDVLPAPWQTWWAYVLYSIAALGALSYIFRTIKVRERLRTNLELEQLERKKAEELEQMKSRFFTGISHEFRTPLTLINSPLEQLAKKYEQDHDTSWMLGLVRRNSARLRRLINQLLDLSKLEAGKLKLQVSKRDIYGWSRDVVSSFDEMARSKGLELYIGIPPGPCELFFDKEKLEHVIFNLLSNAFKFADKRVEVFGEVVRDRFVMTVINDGASIDPEDQAKIFERFYQSERNEPATEGSGIGLALVKEFVTLHHGEVKVSSEEGSTSFIVSIPIDDAAYSKDVKINLESTQVFKAVKQQDEFEEQKLTRERGTEDGDADKPKLLIAEDNTDLRDYLRQEFSSDFDCLTAVDGVEGKELAFDAIPDLIITDVMMPRMDGIAFLELLREDHRTNHIPIIMLTAKSEKETRLAGIEKGADHYLSKPFDMDELMVRAKSLLDQRARIREHYHHEFLTNPSPEEVASIDDVFLKKAVETLEGQLDNHEFTVDQFARELAMSRVQLHRKMKAIIGCSASEFVRNYRLKKAYSYLEARSGSVSQIAYSVGFNNLSYFTKAFKEMYHLNPSQLLKEHES